MNRRLFFQGLAAAVATVAISIRMAPKFLPDSLRGGTWRYEQATEKYFYGLDKAEPWNVQIFEQTDFHDPESWMQITPEELGKRASESLVKIIRATEIARRPPKFKICGPNTLNWPDADYISHETLVECGVDPDNDEEMEALSIIAMSQGMAAYQVVGHGSLADGAYVNNPGMQEIERDFYWVPRVHTTKEELFQHG